MLAGYLVSGSDRFPIIIFQVHSWAVGGRSQQHSVFIPAALQSGYLLKAVL